MTESQFVERIAKIRARFASKLTEKLQETDAALPTLVGGSAAAAAVALVYRRFHEMCGIGATIGFEATGQGAKRIDAILIGPYREHRGLTNDELALLKEGLVSLQTTAKAEIQSKDSDREFVQ